TFRFAGDMEDIRTNSAKTDSTLNTFRESIKSTIYSGIGVGIHKTFRGDLVIGYTLPNSSAEEAGLKTGDIIIKIDGKDVGYDFPVEQAVELISGPAGTFVKLAIARDYEMPKEVTLMRKNMVKPY
ncbi:MAG: PDZ domain-containing protein, partial [Patescibacteria group bacterium]